MSEQLKHTSEPKKRISDAETNPLMQSGRKRSRYPKTDLRYWRESIRKPIYTRGSGELQAPNFAAFFQYRGRRTCLSLGTPNKEAAATHARNIYQFLHANGWPATLQKYQAKHGSKEIGRYDRRFHQGSSGNGRHQRPNPARLLSSIQTDCG